MSRNQKYYDEDDMYDYDDYDDDYVAPPKQKAKPKSATGVKQVATDNKQQSKTIQKQAPVASKVSKTTAVSTNTSKAASADTTSNSLGLGSSSSPTKTSPDEVNTKIISSSTPTSTEHTSQGNVSDDDEPSISTESQQDSLPKVSIIITGHVDAGKSTMLGNLLVQIGNIAKRTIQKYQKESEQIGKGSFALAWVMDECQSERTHGVTIGLAERNISTAKRHITLIDSPGHRDFVPAMISGAGQADAAILVVPATEGEFESSMGTQAQTREHARLLLALGVNTMIVAVNKMDRTSPAPWSEARFKAVESAVKEMLVNLSFKPEQLVFVPVSGLVGENLTIRSGVAHWYSESTLLEAMDAVIPRGGGEVSVGMATSLRAVVTGVVSDVSGKGFEVSVNILRGRIRIKRRVGIPVGLSIIICTVKKIIHHQSGVSTDIASVGEHVTLTLFETSSGGRSADELGIREGICIYKGPPTLQRVMKFHATIKTSTQLDVPILPGTCCEMYIHSFESECVISKIVSTALSTRAKCIGSDCTAKIEVTCDPPVAMETATEFAPLALFVLRNRGKTIATGQCERILESVGLNTIT